MELTKKQALFFKDVKTEHFTTEEIQHWKNKTAPTNLAKMQMIEKKEFRDAQIAREKKLDKLCSMVWIYGKNKTVSQMVGLASKHGCDHYLYKFAGKTQGFTYYHNEQHKMKMKGKEYRNEFELMCEEFQVFLPIEFL